MTRSSQDTDLLGAIRDAVAATAPTPDQAVNADENTLLSALFADSLRALAFISRLEADLDLGELPFEHWLESYAERAEQLTVGALIGWLNQRRVDSAAP